MSVSKRFSNMCIIGQEITIFLLKFRQFSTSCRGVFSCTLPTNSRSICLCFSTVLIFAHVSGHPPISRSVGRASGFKLEACRSRRREDWSVWHIFLVYFCLFIIIFCIFITFFFLFHHSKPHNTPNHNSVSTYKLKEKLILLQHQRVSVYFLCYLGERGSFTK